MRKRSTVNHRDFTARQRWGWWPGMMALLLVMALASSGRLQPVESLVYSLTLQAFAPPAGSGKVAIVELPSDWNPGGLDETFRRLGDARAVAILPPLPTTAGDAALVALERRLEQYRETPQAEPYPTLMALRQELDLRTALSERFSASGNVILGVPYRSGGERFGGLHSEAFGPVEPGGTPLLRRLPTLIAPSVPQAEQPQWPDEALAKAAAAVGLYAADQDRSAFPALVESSGEAYGGLLLQLLRLTHGGMVQPPEFEQGGGVRLGPVQLPTDNAYRFRPYTDLTERTGSGVARYDYEQVAAGRYAISTFTGKSVIIGEAAQALPLALALDALLRQQVVAVPAWAMWGQYAALALVALLLMWLLPRMRFSTASVTTLLVALLLVNGEFLLLLMGQQWLPLMLPLCALLLGYPLIMLQARRVRRESMMAGRLSEANRQLGRLLQVQGELDQAWDRYRLCQPDEPLLEQLYHLGLDFERKRQFAKAVTVFNHLLATVPDFRDVKERIERNQKMEQRVVLAQGGGATPGGTVIMDAEGLQKPTLGHYEVEREIGRGAMGMVYLGRDPRIGRMVAIKTMALSSEFEGAQLEEVRARFYREAETAGRLNHPNIVHVYDIGEEQELAYIAMDFLQGENLGQFVHADSLLTLSEALTVVQQVAEALEYAHSQNVVHRDIKPANIIYDREAGKARVTDFGVACLTDSSKTKTGTVLGSPSYMSPEQVAGKRVDGRADIFSLGVTLYQLVTGHLPFEADSLGSLMYKIANEQHPKPSKYRKGLPACVSRIINKCMQKEPGKRYQSAADLAAALGRCGK